jgi:hypothetical protein
MDFCKTTRRKRNRTMFTEAMERTSTYFFFPAALVVFFVAAFASAGGSFLLLLFTDRAGRPWPAGLSFLLVFVIVALLTNFGLPTKIMSKKNRQMCESPPTNETPNASPASSAHNDSRDMQQPTMNVTLKKRPKNPLNNVSECNERPGAPSCRHQVPSTMVKLTVLEADGRSDSDANYQSMLTVHWCHRIHHNILRRLEARCHQEDNSILADTKKHQKTMMMHPQMLLPKKKRGQRPLGLMQHQGP